MQWQNKCFRCKNNDGHEQNFPFLGIEFCMFFENKIIAVRVQVSTTHICDETMAVCMVSSRSHNSSLSRYFATLHWLESLLMAPF